MDQIDFNINNYSIQNLEDFFKFSTKNYTEDDIQRNIQLMKTKLLNCKELTNTLKEEINTFLNKSRIILTSNIEMNSKNYNFNPTKNTDINTVYNYKYPNGIINPVERQIQTKTVCINSLFRANFFKTNSCSFDYTFPTPIENVINMRAAFVEMPIFWYSISKIKKNNTFTIEIFNMEIANVLQPNTTNTIVIEDGNYTNTALVTYLNNYFFYTNNGLQFLVFAISDISTKTTLRAKTTIDNDTNLYYPFDAGTYYSPNFYYTITFSNVEFFDANDTTPPKTTVDCLNIKKPCPNSTPQCDNNTQKCSTPYASYLASSASILGFKNNKYTATYNNTYFDYSTATTYHCYLQGEYAYGRDLFQYLFLEINDYQNNFTTDSVISIIGNNNYAGNNILAVIPITGNSNSIMFNNSSDGIVKCREYFGPVRLNKLTIRILSQYGTVLDLNGYDYFIILELQQLYTNYKTNE